MEGKGLKGGRERLGLPQGQGPDGRYSELAKDCTSIPGFPILTKAFTSKWQIGTYFIQPCVSLQCNF